jgi:hydroxypyruvate reductase 1
VTDVSWRTLNPTGQRRVVVTKELPGELWLRRLTDAGCRVDICTSDRICDSAQIAEAIGDRCDAAIGQLTEVWGEELFAVLKAAGGRAYSNYAVGFNNVDVDAATRHELPVGNTPGVLTEATAEMAVSLTFSAGRRVVEADTFLRAGRYHGWLPTLFLGKRFAGATVGVIGAGRIGAAYARMMVEGHKMNLVYYDVYRNQQLEDYISAYASFLAARGEHPVTWRRAGTVEELLAEADVVSLHPILDESTHHLINSERLALMKPDAILVNASRGPVVDERALVEHCRAHPEFRVALDVFEDEPALAPGLVELENAVIVPHIASATRWTREGMATLAATNVAAVLSGYPAWQKPDILPFLEGVPPRAAPSIVNAEALGYPTM